MKYNGFYFLKDKFENNEDFYKDCLKNLDRVALIGVSKKDAQRALEFSKRFGDRRPHARLVGHKVDVYSIENPLWGKRGKLVAPKGKLINVFSIDLGKEISNICNADINVYEIVERDVKKDLGDGTFVVGDIIRNSRYSGTEENKEIKNPYLNINFDCSFFEEKDNFSYYFDINRKAITQNNPLEFKIKTYVLIDGELINEEIEFIRPLFKPINSDTSLPKKLSHLTCSKN